MKLISLKEAKTLGLKRYFTGKTCIYGHIAERQVSNSRCLQCRRVIFKKNSSPTKKCTSCGKTLEKNEKNFRYKNKSKGILTFRQPCRICQKQERTEWGKTSRGKELKSGYDKNYVASGKKAKADKRYYKKHKAKLNKKAVIRRTIARKTDEKRWLHDNVSARLRVALKEKNITKKNKITEYIGCSIEDLKKHLEQYFIYDEKLKKTYSWENRGRNGWDIDHIVPISYFKKNYDFLDFNIQKICWHYLNLKPLWSEVNRNIKKDNINVEFAEKKIKEIKKSIFNK